MLRHTQATRPRTCRCPPGTAIPPHTRSRTRHSSRRRSTCPRMHSHSPRAHQGTRWRRNASRRPEETRGTPRRDTRVRANTRADTWSRREATRSPDPPDTLRCRRARPRRAGRSRSGCTRGLRAECTPGRKPLERAPRRPGIPPRPQFPGTTPPSSHLHPRWASHSRTRAHTPRGRRARPCTAEILSRICSWVLHVRRASMLCPPSTLSRRAPDRLCPMLTHLATWKTLSCSGAPSSVRSDTPTTTLEPDASTSAPNPSASSGRALLRYPVCAQTSWRRPKK